MEKSGVKQPVKRRIRLWTALITSLILALISPFIGRSHAETGRSEPNAPFWPPAPNARRIQYLRCISTPSDIGSRPSLLNRMGRWLTGADSDDCILQKPFGLAVDELGNLCITDTAAKRICYCDFLHKNWHHYEAAGATRFVSPVAVACVENTLFVADSGLGKVFAMRLDGRVLWELGKPLERPVGLAISTNRLAVADSVRHAIWVFDLQGHQVLEFGQRGVGDGEFNFPTHIASDTQGHWIVTDSLNSRVQVFSADGKFLSQLGSTGDTSGHFSRPKGVTVDQFGHVYVADAMFDNVQVFNLSGQFLLNFGKSGTATGEFGLPCGVAAGPHNEIYVADSFNHRVQVFAYVGGPEP